MAKISQITVASGHNLLMCDLEQGLGLALNYADVVFLHN